MGSNPYLAHLEPTSKKKPFLNAVLTRQNQEKIEEGPNNIYTGQPFSDKYYEILKKRRDLPVYSRRREFLELVAQNQFIILVGETGSGKTTQIPQFLLHELLVEKPDKIIGCTQPDE